jgi:hypothetical protein
MSRGSRWPGPSDREQDAQAIRAVARRGASSGPTHASHWSTTVIIGDRDGARDPAPARDRRRMPRGREERGCRPAMRGASRAGSAIPDQACRGYAPFAQDQPVAQDPCPWCSDPPRRPAVTGIARVAGLPAAPSGWVRTGDLAPVLTAQSRPDQGDPSCPVLGLLPADGEESGSPLRRPQRRLPHVGLCNLRIRFGHHGFVVAHAPVRTALAPDSPDCRCESSGYEGSTGRAVANVGAKD